MADPLAAATQELIIAQQTGDAEEKVGKIIQLLTITKSISSPKNVLNSNISLDNIIVSVPLLKCLRLMLVDNDRQIRVQSCRAMRYITLNISILSSMIKLNIPIFMMRCLEREDNKYLWERMQSLKWIRHLMDYYPQKIPKCCIMSLIAIAQNGKDEFRRICLDSLRELCITNPAIINKCNGFKVLIDSILNPQLSDISNSLVLTILYILDHPNTRKYLRPSLDIQRLLAPFVDVNPYKKDVLTSAQKEEKEKKRLIAERTLMTMLKSITGIFYLGSDIGSCLRTLVNLMKLPNNISGIQWARRTIFNVLENALSPLSDSLKLDHQRGPNLIVNYVCLILMAFIRNGLIECLVDVGMRSDLDLAPRARTLLQRIQFLSAKYLPPSLCSRICGIPSVINDAAMFNNNINSKLTSLQITVQRNFANMMISELTEGASLDDFDDHDDDNNNNDNKDDNDNNIDDISSETICHRLGPEFDLNSTFIRYRYMMDRDIPAMMFQDRIPYHSHRKDNEYRFGGRGGGTDDFTQFSFKSQKSLILENLKFDQNKSYTENVILGMLKKTRVVSTKDFMLWNMDSVWKVINGPLWYLGNLQIALKTKFIKRLLQYLKPSRQFFSQLKWSLSTIRHAQCACQMFRLLTSCDVGCSNQFFIELISEIFNCLKDQIQSNLKKRRPNLSHSPFSRPSQKYTLSRIYITLIGILSESSRGYKFFQQHSMISFLLGLTRKEITDHSMKKDRIVGPNDYLLRLIATNLDYTLLEDFRMLFSQWIASGSFYLRKCLITHLELLYRAQMPSFDEWSINVLAVLLKQEQRLALTALKVLEKINLSQHSIKSREYLIDLIHTQPTDSIIGIYGQFLFIKMLSTKEGLLFLINNKWIINKRREWCKIFNKKYTNMLETALVMSVETANNNNTDTDNNDNEWLPYHLIHENRSDEEELYAEYLTHFPWSLSITIIRASGQEIELSTDVFFDYNCFYYKDPPHDTVPVSLGPGIHAIILDKAGCSKPVNIDKNARIRCSLNIGHECLNDLYNKKKSLTRTVSIIEAEEHTTYSLIHCDQTYFFFDNQKQLIRVFWSLASIQKSHSLVRPLPHFYGELAKTKEGCEYILKQNDFNNDLKGFIRTVHNAYLNNNQVVVSNDRDNNLNLRSCLWALGMIGSSATGLNLLNQYHNSNIIDDICILTSQSATLSIRGTCLYVLGLLSRTPSGMNQLSSYGFGFPADNLELDLAVAIPEDITHFFEMGQTNYISSSYLSNIRIHCYSPPSLCRPANMKPMDPNELLGKQGHTEETVLAHISALCNNVTQKSSASALHRLRTKKPSVFSNPLLFRETLKLLNTYQFKLAAKRFILYTLFDQVILSSASMNLFDHSQNDPILSFKQIREWRYNHKQMLIEKKQKKYKQKQKQLQLKQKQIKNDPNVVHIVHKSTHIQEPRTPHYKPKNEQKTAHQSPQIDYQQQPPPIPKHIKMKYNQSQQQPIKNKYNNNNSPIKNKNKKNKINNNNNSFTKPQPPANRRATTQHTKNKKKRISTKQKNNINDLNNNNIPKRGRADTAKKKPPRPWPPIKASNNNNIANNNNTNSNNNGSDIQRRISQLQQSQQINIINIPPPSNIQNPNISVGYDHDLADSPTKHVHGPNPLADDKID